MIQAKWKNIGKVMLCCSLYFNAAAMTFAGTQLSLIPSDIMPDNGVVAAAEDKPNHALYLGGHFSGVYKKTGGGAVFDDQGHLGSHVPVFKGLVRTSVSDGRGGFYVGGTFNNIGTTGIKYLAHIKADGSVDTQFHAAISSGVNQLSRVGNKLYVGLQRSVSEVDLSTGTINPAFSLTTNHNIFSMLATKNAVYIGGYFSQVNSESVRFFAKANGDTGAVDTHFFKAPSAVYGIAASSDDKLYLIGHHFAGDVAKVDELTGHQDNSFDTQLTSIPSVIAADDGWLYVSTRTAPYVARYSTVNGEKDGGFTVKAVHTPTSFDFDHQHIYMTATFASVGGDRRFDKVARFDKTTLQRDSEFNPYIDNRAVTASLSDGHYFVGGYFQSAGKNLAQSNLVKIDLTTGQPDSTFKPQLDGSVTSIALTDDSVFVGGTFNKVSGLSVNRLAKLAKSSGEVDPSFKPKPNSNVYVLAVHGDYLYAGGYFSVIAGRYLSKGLARFKLDDMSYDTVFHPHFNRMVWSMAFAGDALYVGGTFTNNLEKYNVVTGEKDLNFNPVVEGTVKDILIDGDSVFAGGYFTGGVKKFNRHTGADDVNFNPIEVTTIFSLAKHNGLLYIGGNKELVRLDAQTGVVDTSFSPQPDGVVYGLLTDGDFLGAFGHFNHIMGELQPRVAVMNLS
ncbi:MAG: hypothetical protein P1U40_10325 [Coxiellaceae bacterium]|nr:hypothetical protein [Coxiellaceae bacterium]